MSPASKNPYIISNGSNTSSSDVLLMHINYKKIWLEKSEKIIENYYHNLPKPLAIRIYRASLWPRQQYWHDLAPTLSYINNDEILEAIILSLALYAKQHFHHIVAFNQEQQCGQDIDKYCQDNAIVLAPGHDRSKPISSQDLFNILSIILKYKEVDYSNSDFNYDLEKQKNMIKHIMLKHSSSSEIIDNSKPEAGQ